MSTVARIRTRLTGFPGAPGVATFVCLDPATFRPGLIAFWNTVKTVMPATVTLTTEPEGDIFDDTNGQITGSWTEGTDAVSTGSASTYAGPVGASVTWRTSGVVGGKRVKGRTFIVPLNGDNYDSFGSLTDPLLTLLRGAASTLVAASPGQLLVWSRPIVIGDLDSKGEQKPIRDGSTWAVGAASVRDSVAVLRSRRE